MESTQAHQPVPDTRELQLYAPLGVLKAAVDLCVPLNALQLPLAADCSPVDFFLYLILETL